jgi:putative transposase
MAKPCSNDLRERVVAAVEEDGLSRHQAAARFSVGVSSVIRWVTRFRETGSVAPDKMGGNRPKTIRGEHRDWLIQRCKEKDFTLRGLVVELAARKVIVDYRSVWEFVHAEKLSFKKKRASQRTRPARCRAKARAVEDVSGPDRA